MGSYSFKTNPKMTPTKKESPTYNNSNLSTKTTNPDYRHPNVTNKEATAPSNYHHQRKSTISGNLDPL